MLAPCTMCDAESIYFIKLVSDNADPVGEWWFCSFQHLKDWLEYFPTKDLLKCASRR